MNASAMTWQQKAAALNALSELQLRIDVNNQWFVHHVRVEIGDGHIRKSIAGRGCTPEEAINDQWRHNVTELDLNGKYLVVNAMGQNRRHVRWNGFMWQELPQAKS